jgi:hypothetical protein
MQLGTIYVRPEHGRCTFQDDFGHTKHVKGQTAWGLVHEGNTWKIRENTYDQSEPY